MENKYNSYEDYDLQSLRSVQKYIDNKLFKLFDLNPKTAEEKDNKIRECKYWLDELNLVHIFVSAHLKANLKANLKNQFSNS